MGGAKERMRSLGAAPMARIVGQATSGLAPKLLLMTPVESIRKLLKKIGWTIGEVDLFDERSVAAAVRDGAPMPVDPADAVCSMAVLDAARLSARTGNAVRL